MDRMTTGQARAYFALGCFVAVALVVIGFIIDLAVGLLFLVAAVLILCLLRVRKPEIFDRMKKPKDEMPIVNSGSHGIDRSAFKAHLVLVYNNGITTQHIAVDKPVFTIGRSENCDLCLRGNSDISRNHAVIEYNPKTGRSILRDANSFNGTRINGERLRSGMTAELHNNDYIQIEDRSISVQQKYY